MAKLYWNDVKTYFSESLFYLFNKNSEAAFQEGNNGLKKEMDEAIDYAIRNVQYILSFLPTKDKESLKNNTLLEIGPGQDFGVALILADLGLKKIILIDPYLIQWNKKYHPFFYEALLHEAQATFPDTEFTSIKEIISNQSHVTAKLVSLKVGLEKVAAIPDNSIDISISNACFEHLVYPEKAIEELARITKKEGIGFHQIDLRDHRNFEKPLEFLSFSERTFSKIKKMTAARFGNRLRFTEFIEIFQKHQFSVVFKPDLVADEKYIKEIQQKACKKYKEMSPESIGTLGGRFFIEKLA